MLRTNPETTGHETPLTPGQLIARGVCRHLAAHDLATLTEFVPARGLRVDVIAIGPQGDIWIVECKSSRADYGADHKWQGYLDWCDRFYFAVGDDFPQEILPDGCGIILADGFDAGIVRDAPVSRLAPARRKALTLRLARAGASRLRRLLDPGLGAGAI